MRPIREEDQLPEKIVVYRRREKKATKEIRHRAFVGLSLFQGIILMKERKIGDRTNSPGGRAGY
jgi:hypothetical protein